MLVWIPLCTQLLAYSTRATGMGSPTGSLPQTAGLLPQIAGLLPQTAGSLSRAAGSLTPPPLVQATVNDQKLTEPTPSVASTRALLPRRNLRETRVDMMCYSENQEVKHATNALLANRATLTQNMNFWFSKPRYQEAHMAHSRTN